MFSELRHRVVPDRDDNRTISLRNNDNPSELQVGMGIGTLVTCTR